MLKADKGTEQSYAPTILIDQQDVPWLAWSGVREQQLADIYVSKWDGKGWLEPVRVHEPNQSPDITPILGLNKETKSPWVAWFGISQKENIYVRFLAELREGKWQVAEQSNSIDETKDFLEKRIAVESFPEQAGQWLTGALFAGLEGEIQSVSEHFVSFREKEGEK
ncbi:hypothetical protein [Candidatus Electronema sp. PJ]|uniref:hypothetical protein n=1 Tax=Candidatus Electronema sp. PJ TaxID=3401572 RepID=UPI003AA86C74